MLQVGQRIGNYRILRQLGEGGMGVVYEALRDDIGSRAAIKVLRTEYAMNAEIAQRFFNEARAANLIEHPGIVKIFDYGQLPSGAPYLAMEFLSGESLHQRLVREKKLSEADCIRLGRQMATALAAAHGKQVIHRDLKPENIFIVPDAEAPSGERAKVLDFGLAKLARTSRGAWKTGTNVVMGTPIYMSPEQCKGGKHVDERADVYALGVMLFEMLSGRTPFIADEPGEYIGMHLFKEPPAIGSLVPTLLPKLRQLVDSMLIKEPQQRPPMVMVSAVLKELSTVSTDMVSVEALVADASIDAETQRMERIIPLPATAAKTANHTEGWTQLPILQGTKALQKDAQPSSEAGSQAMAALSPLRRSVDPLEVTEPDKASPFASTARQKRAFPAPPPAAPPPPEKPATLPLEQPKTMPIETATASPGAQPKTLPLPTKKPGPPLEATVKLPAVKKSQNANEIPTPRRNAPTPDWQSVVVVAGDVPTIENLDGDSMGPEGEPGAKRVRSFARQLRRLRFQIKRRVLSWFGITVAEQRKTPARPGSQGQRIWLLLAILASGLGVGLLFLMIQRPSPDDVAVTAHTDRASTPTSETPGEELPAVPMPPDLLNRLSAAREKAEAGRPAAAFKEVRAALAKYNHPAAWSALGAYACQNDNVKTANEALDHLAADVPMNRRYRNELLTACGRQGVTLNSSGHFTAPN